MNVYDDTTDQLCISEAGVTGTAKADSGSPSLVDFLKGLRQAADDFPGLALVVFDTRRRRSQRSTASRSSPRSAST